MKEVRISVDQVTGSKTQRGMALGAALGLFVLASTAACDKTSSAETQTVRLPATSVTASAPKAAGSGSSGELMKVSAGGEAAAPGSAPSAPAGGGEAAPAGGGNAGAAAKNYEVSVTPPASVKVGAASTVSVRLVPTNGYKVNLEYPIELKVSPPAGVKLAKLVHAKSDGQIDAKHADFQVGFTAENGGPKAFNAEFKFSVCTPKFCEIKSEKLAWSVAAE